MTVSRDHCNDWRVEHQQEKGRGKKRSSSRKQEGSHEIRVDDM
ncbi:hypothetical protein COLO4_19407 [Corchorus olitorius]|uniref:Uncharacterized protein n=1 Tax=Corchorus olitorius TaxID=93759 RepID=A0A1R3J5L0_9ROSI|nr:hypothetical protein COLO4_19407 [Corchorus olitorius]